MASLVYFKDPGQPRVHDEILSQKEKKEKVFYRSGKIVQGEKIKEQFIDEGFLTKSMEVHNSSIHE